MNEKEWRTGVKEDGTRVVQDGAVSTPSAPAPEEKRGIAALVAVTNGSESLNLAPPTAPTAPTAPTPAKRHWTTPALTPLPHDAKATGAFIEGVHIDPENTNRDAASLGTMIVRVQAEVAAIGAEALRIKDAALEQVDALKRLATYDSKEAEVRSKAAYYDEMATLVKNELVNKRKWTIIGVRDAFFALFNDNVQLSADLDREKRNLKTTLEDYKAMEEKHLTKIAELEKTATDARIRNDTLSDELRLLRLRR